MARRIAMPESVVIGPHTFALEVNTAKVDAECVASQRRILGYTDIGGLRIYLTGAPVLVGTMLREVVVHECLHAIWDEQGLSYAMRQNTAYTEEALIQQCDTAVLALMRDNPALVAWLTAED